MISWTRIASARVPQDAGEFRLMKRGTEFSIMLGLHGTHEQPAHGLGTRTGYDRRPEIRDAPAAAVLVGGLGMGFTLRAALAELTAGSTSPSWNWCRPWSNGHEGRWPTSSAIASRIRASSSAKGMSAAIIRRSRSAFDAILLDVDNGPDGLTQAANDRLYDLEGLGHACRALRPNGVLAVWSSARDEAFSRRLRQAGFTSTSSRCVLGRARFPAT